MSSKNAENKFTSDIDIVYNKEEQVRRIVHLPTEGNEGIIVHTDTIEKSTHTYQDRFIRYLYEDKKRAIELCGALSEIDYPQDTKAERYDLEKSLFKRFNDLAIVINDKQLYVIEATSTISSNFPLRILLYVADILSSWFIENKQLYQSKLIKIPEIKCYVLYSGKAPLKETELKLSNSFKTNDGSNDSFDLEITVLIIDINLSSGSTILQRSESLRGYAYLIDYIKRGIGRRIVFAQ